MTIIVPESSELRATLAALPELVQSTIEARPHGWIGRPRMVILVAKVTQADELVRELAARFGVCRWGAGRWHVDRAQLSLFPARAAIL